MTIGVESTVVDAAFEAVLDESGTGGPISFAVCDVVLHAGVGINLEFDRSHGSSEPGVKRASILILVVVFWVAINSQCMIKRIPKINLLDVLFRSIDTQSLTCHFELCSSVAKVQEG